MNPSPKSPNSHAASQKAPGVIVVIASLFAVFGGPFLPLVISGRWNWAEAWLYATLFIVAWLLSRGLAAWRHPDLAAERAQFLRHEGVPTWDRVLAPAVAYLGLAVQAVAGLEALWAPRAPFDPAVKIAALALFGLGYALGAWAMMENRFFSGQVRLQTERGHTVVTGGPYRWLRHPGYVSALVVYLSTPFLLDSVWALAPAALIGALLVARTALEDRFLLAKLPGYADYARRVRYRLFPPFW